MQLTSRLKKYRFLACILVSFFISQCVWADSISVQRFTSNILGMADASMATEMDNIGNIFINPAILANGSKSQIYSHISYIADHRQLTNALTRQTFNAFPLNYNVGNNNAQQSRQSAFDMGFYFKEQVAKHIAIGLSVNSPWDDLVKYDTNWVGRYVTLSSQLKTLDVTPMLAFRLRSNLSVGFGLQYLKMKIKYEEMTGIGQPFNVQSTPSTGEGKSWGAGYTVGVLYSPMKKLRLGLSYISTTALTISTLNILNEAGSNGQAVYGNTLVKTPDVINTGARYQLKPAWVLYTNLRYIFWKDYDYASVSNISSNNGSYYHVRTRVTTNIRNTWTWSIGNQIKLNQQIKVACGLAYHHPAQRIIHGGFLHGVMWFATGISYSFGQDHAIYLSYLHILNHQEHESMRVDSSTPPNNSLVNRLAYDSQSDTNVISFGLKYIF